MAGNLVIESQAKKVQYRNYRIYLTIARSKYCTNEIMTLFLFNCSWKSGSVQY